MIVISDNRATNRIIDLLGMDHLNAEFARYGWRTTVLRRRMMDLDAPAEGRDNVSSPRDIVDLFRRLVCGDLVSRQATEILLAMLKAQEFRDRLPARLPPDVAVAHKTGDLNATRNDSGVLFLPTGPIVASVFTNDLHAPFEGMLAIQEIGALIYATRG